MLQELKDESKKHQLKRLIKMMNEKLMHEEDEEKGRMEEDNRHDYDLAAESHRHDKEDYEDTEDDLAHHKKQLDEGHDPEREEADIRHDKDALRRLAHDEGEEDHDEDMHDEAMKFLRGEDRPDLKKKDRRLQMPKAKGRMMEAEMIIEQGPKRKGRKKPR